MKQSNYEIIKMSQYFKYKYALETLSLCNLGIKLITHEFIIYIFELTFLFYKRAENK